MYVRKKFMRRGDKAYGPYWQVVHSTRVDGKPRQRVVANVGLAEDRKQADGLARMKGLLCGVPGCGEAATVELEYQGFRATSEKKLPGGGSIEAPYLVCPDHLDAWRRRERFGVYPAFLCDWPNLGSAPPRYG
jgi:hypothetical protein